MNHEYQKYEFEGYNIHTIKSDRFKKCRIEVRFTSRVNAKDITQRNFVSSLLMESTKKYPNSRLMNIYEEELYNIDVFDHIQKCGEYLIMNYCAVFVNPKYTEEDMLKKSIEYLCEIIFNPDISDGKFNKKSFDLIMNMAKNYFKAVDDRPESRAQRKLVSVMGKGTSFDILVAGKKKDLKLINPINIIDTYNKHIYDDRCDIFIYGDIDMDKAILLIHDCFKKRTKNNINLGSHLFNIIDNKKVNNIILYDKIVQSAYMEGYIFKDLNRFERCYVIGVFNRLFGGNIYSKLFITIREKYSLCYDISSVYNDINGSLFVRTSLDSKNIKKCQKLIKQCLKEMINGEFDEVELENIKKEKINNIEYIDESQNSTIGFYYDIDLLGDDTKEETTKQISKVTKDDVVNVAKKIKLHTTVLVREAKNEETSN